MNVDDILNTSLEDLERKSDRTLLGITASSTRKEIDLAKRRLMQALHHDNARYINWSDEDKRQKLTPRFDLIMKAHQRVVDGNARYADTTKSSNDTKSSESTRTNKWAYKWDSFYEYAADDIVNRKNQNQNNDYDYGSELLNHDTKLEISDEILIKMVSAFRSSAEFKEKRAHPWMYFEVPTSIFRLRINLKDGRSIHVNSRVVQVKVEIPMLAALIEGAPPDDLDLLVMAVIEPDLDKLDAPTLCELPNDFNATSFVRVYAGKSIERMSKNATIVKTVPLETAMFGGIYTVELSDDEILQVRVPAGSSNGSKLNLKGKGLPIFEATVAGRKLKINGFNDLRLQLEVEIPNPKEMTNEQIMSFINKLTSK